jgi:hypothetical protein
MNLQERSGGGNRNCHVHYTIMVDVRAYFAFCIKASGNVAGLCNWAEAMCKYHKIAKAVEPKIVALKGAEAELKVHHHQCVDINIEAAKQPK